MLRFRAGLLQRLRKFFDDRGFVEVETPVLSADAVVDVHLDPISVTLFNDPRNRKSGSTMWLQTSPEFAMKRLLASGAERIYQITKAFRAGESGSQHNPEFTIVEWYRVGDSMQAGMDLLAELATVTLGSQQVERLSYEAAFRQHVGLNPHTATAHELATRTEQLQRTPPLGLGHDRDAWLNYLLAECVERKLGRERPVILFDYPASQAALSRLRRADSTAGPECLSYEVAERFELYVNGVELANGYHELLDAEILRERNRTANAARIADGRYAVPEESRLLAAMDHGLPACSGVALGFDRLVMVAAGAGTLPEVMAFPIDRA
jgi:lysyl-tRNA synthetase class 2